MTEAEGLIIGSLLDAWTSIRAQLQDEMGEDGQGLTKWLDALNWYMETGEAPKAD